MKVGAIFKCSISTMYVGDLMLPFSPYSRLYKTKKGTLANSEDLKEILRNEVFHQGLHC